MISHAIPSPPKGERRCSGGNATTLPGPPLAERLWGERWGKQSGTFSVHLHEQGRPQGASFSAGDLSFVPRFPPLPEPRHPVSVVQSRRPDGSGSDRMEEMKNRLEALDQFSQERDDLAMLFADAHQLTMDGEGRIILPEELKEHAHIGDECAFVGLGASFQIWEPSRFAAHRAEARERTRRQGTTLPAGPRPA